MNAFRTLAVALFGATGWRRKVADTLKVSRATVWRWEKGEQAVPHAAMLALEGLRFARMYRELKADRPKKRRLAR